MRLVGPQPLPKQCGVKNDVNVNFSPIGLGQFIDIVRQHVTPPLLMLLEHILLITNDSLSGDAVLRRNRPSYVVPKDFVPHDIRNVIVVLDKLLKKVIKLEVDGSRIVRIQRHLARLASLIRCHAHQGDVSNEEVVRVSLACVSLLSFVWDVCDEDVGFSRDDLIAVSEILRSNGQLVRVEFVTNPASVRVPPRDAVSMRRSVLREAVGPHVRIPPQSEMAALFHSRGKCKPCDRLLERANGCHREQCKYCHDEDHWQQRFERRSHVRIRNRQHSAQHREAAIEHEHSCVVCLSATPTVLLVPCNHLCLCVQCASKIEEGGVIKVCPFCLQTVSSVTIVYLP